MKKTSAAFLVKLPAAMLERWRISAQKRGMTMSQMIREAVNRDIDSSERK